MIQKVESLSPVFYWRPDEKNCLCGIIDACVDKWSWKVQVVYGISTKGIRTNFFSITDISKTISDINADDHGAYLKSRNTNKSYYFHNDQTNVVREDISGKFYYNKRLSRNTYKKVYIPLDKIVKLNLTYTKAKSFPLTRTFIKVSNPASGPRSFFVSVFYQTSAIAEKDEVLNHTFRRPKMFCKKLNVNELNAKTVYDEIKKESGEYPSSTRHVASTSTKRKSKKEQRNEHTGIVRRVISNNAAAFWSRIYKNYFVYRW